MNSGASHSNTAVIYEGAACQVESALNFSAPWGAVLEYTTNSRKQGRATLESDSSGIRLPG